MLRNILTVGTLACFVILTAGAVPAREAAPRPPSVLLITIDTLRADHLGCYGYFRDTSPAIDAFARQSLVFDNAFTTMSTTLPAHVSLLTSTYPARHGVHRNMDFYEQPDGDGEGPLSVAQDLRRAGYSTAAFVSVGHLGPGSGIGAGFETFPAVDVDRKKASDMTDRALAWLQPRRERPFFLWVHYFDPHAPYDAPAPYDGMYKDEEPLKEFLERKQVPRHQHATAAPLNNRYDEEIRFTDAEIGRLLGKLDEWRLTDDTLVILTSDHGEGLMQHDIAGHGFIYNEQLHIPLIVRFPSAAGMAPRREPGLVSLIDVFPTAAPVAGLPVDASRLDGINVLDAPRAGALAQRSSRYGPDENFALLDGRWKYTYHENQPDALHDMRGDFVETRNVIEEFPDVATAMRERLLGMVAAERSRGPHLAVRENIPRDSERSLRSLGYVD